MPEEKAPTLMFDWCKECTCYRQCYWQTNGEISNTPLCLDPDCAEGPAR